MKTTTRYLVCMLTLALVAATVSATPARAASLSADVVVVVDSSGSMAQKVREVQNGLNSFAGSITGAGVDLHLILIASSSSSGNGICVSTPLGSGICPDDQNLPLYRHVVQAVDGNSTLSIILNTFNQWQGSMRPGASKEFLVVSDDDSSLSAANFNTGLLALDAGLQGYRFNGIVASYSGGPFDPCSSIGTSGTQYLNLINQTGGVLSNLCTGTVTSGLGAIAQGVIVNASPVPVPAALWLFGSGLMGLAAVTRRRRTLSAVT